MQSQRRSQQNGYCKDNDLEFSAYQNKLGRFCERTADAPDAASASSLSRLLLRSEKELYGRMKPQGPHGLYQ